MTDQEVRLPQLRSLRINLVRLKSFVLSVINILWRRASSANVVLNGNIESAQVFLRTSTKLSVTPHLISCFFCSLCRPKVALALKFFNEIEQKQKSLDEKVKQLEEKVNTLTNTTVTNTETILSRPPEASSDIVTSGITSKTIPNNPTPPPLPPPLVSDKRFNVVLYGINETSKATSRSERQKHDLDNLLAVLSDIDSSFTSASIKDFHRLGKFKENSTHPRSILVKFLRAFEASLVLSKKGSLNSPISIKPDMTRDERETEQALLKERRRLIDSGVERKDIKIHSSSLYVNNKLHGSVQNSQFHPVINSPNNKEHSTRSSPVDSSEPMSINSDPTPATESS